MIFVKVKVYFSPLFLSLTICFPSRPTAKTLLGTTSLPGGKQKKQECLGTKVHVVSDKFGELVYIVLNCVKLGEFLKVR